ncbi:hypothetical protein SGP16026_11680 [Shigella flexneri]|nr:hypothetical protein SGP16026_11680 [Shigella flexneri]
MKNGIRKEGKRIQGCAEKWGKWQFLFTFAAEEKENKQKCPGGCDCDYQRCVLRLCPHCDSGDQEDITKAEGFCSFYCLKSAS